MSGKDATTILAADDDACREAAETLRRGGLVAVPTETVYGLAARGDDDAAVAGIFAAKGRPANNPLILHVLDENCAKDYAYFSPTALRLAARFWPGPMTLVLPRKSDIPVARAVTAGLSTLAIRVPAHPVLQRLLSYCDFPLAAPSANRSGYVSPTSARHVLLTLDGKIDCVLDGGPTRSGLESTIIAVRDDGSIEELRPGPITMSSITEMLGTDLGAVKLRGATSETLLVEAPGMLERHYAPGKPMRLNASFARSDEFHIGFGSTPGHCNLSATADLDEAGRRLYSVLHDAAASPLPAIAVASIPDCGVGKAINDRLQRAAA